MDGLERPVIPSSNLKTSEGFESYLLNFPMWTKNFHLILLKILLHPRQLLKLIFSRQSAINENRQTIPFDCC